MNRPRPHLRFFVIALPVVLSAIIDGITSIPVTDRTGGSTNDRLQTTGISDRLDAAELSTEVNDSVRREEMDMEQRFTAWSDSFWNSTGSEHDVRQFQAELIIKNMDTTVNPCEDFYEYACGSWVKHNPIPATKIRQTVFHVLRDYTLLATKHLLTDTPAGSDSNNAENKAKNLYVACMNEDRRKKRGLQPLLDYISELGGWPVLDPNWSADNFDWVKLSAKLRLNKKAILIGSGVETDLLNSNVYVTYITPAQTRSKHSIFDNAKRLGNLRTHMETVMKLFGIADDLATQTTQEVVTFMQDLHNINANFSEIQQALETYRRITIRDLSAEVPSIDWKMYLGIAQNRTIPDDMEISVVFLDYMNRLVDLMNRTDSRIIANYMIGKVVTSYTDYLDDRFKEADTIFIRSETGSKKEIPPKWMKCVSEVNKNFGMAAGAMFVKKHFDNTSKSDVIWLTNELKNKFRDTLTEIDWLDEPTKAEAHRKLDALGLQVGYPDFILNPDQLNSWFLNYTVDPEKYFENILSAQRADVARENRLMGKTVNKKLWSSYPHVVNAYFKQNSNDIFFPAGILLPPFYHKFFPMSMKFGGLGSFLGHEMTHGFDSAGREFDLHGNVRNWWTNDSSKAFNDRVKCMVGQYNNYTFHNKSLDGEVSKGENIADNGALRLAFKAYEKWLEQNENLVERERLPGLDFTPKQLFFLSNAQLWCGAIRPDSIEYQLRVDNHTPEKYRLIGTISNFEEFGKQFNCPLGSPMNPERKCKVW